MPVEVCPGNTVASLPPLICIHSPPDIAPLALDFIWNIPLHIADLTAQHRGPFFSGPAALSPDCRGPRVAEPDASASVHSGSARRGARPASGIEEVTFNDLRSTVVTTVAALAQPLTMLILMVRAPVAALRMPPTAVPPSLPAPPAEPLRPNPALLRQMRSRSRALDCARQWSQRQDRSPFHPALMRRCAMLTSTRGREATFGRDPPAKRHPRQTWSPSSAHPDRLAVLSSTFTTGTQASRYPNG